MKKAKKDRIFSGRYLLLLLSAFALSTGASYFVLKGKFSFDSSFISEIESRQNRSQHEDRAVDGPGKLYGADAVHDGHDEEDRNTGLVAAEEAVRRDLRAYNVKLLDLYMDRDGVVYIDCGNELKKDFQGDAGQELKIIAGLYTSVKEAVPALTAVKILLGGHEAETIGGHIDISRPLGREIAENG